MSTHEAIIQWKRTTPDFHLDSYSRDHSWRFGSGSSVAATAAPEFRGSPTLVNPEEALVAAVSSCHMLTFLAIAARKGLVVDAYEDRAVGHLTKDDRGRLVVSRVVLSPRVTFRGA